MSIAKPAAWKAFQVTNASDPYGKCCVDVAAEVMRLLDARPGPFDPHKLVCEADDNIKAGGITGFMAGAVAQIVSIVHSRGEEFRRAWNLGMQLNGEGERANQKPGDVLNPAMMSVGRGPKVRP